MPPPSFPHPPSRAQAPAGIQAVCPLLHLLSKDDAFGIKWVPAFAGTTDGERIGFVSQIFFDAVDFKAFLTPEKRFRNEMPTSA
jgi:hypothetical protein